MKKGKRIPGHRHCPNLVRDAGKKPPPARGTTHYSRGALSSTALLSVLNCARACPSIVGIERVSPSSSFWSGWSVLLLAGGQVYN